jgi:pyruvate ferredoxin oxidoreductase alpha subunit
MKMPKNVISGAQAVAEAVKLCKPGVIAIYPITPQTLISEAIAQMVADGDLDAELIMVESEHSAMAACMGAAATGVRTCTATSSQGLALMHEMLFAASGMRLPVVMSVANRALNSPLNIWNDQQDSFAQRDAGWVQLYAESAQEAFDTQIQAFRVAEEVRLPAMVCIDGYVITHTYEPVNLAGQEVVDRFLPKPKPADVLNPSKPLTLGAVGGPDHYIFFRKQQQEAMEKAAEAIQKANIEYNSAMGRKYGNGLIETVNLKGAEHAIITIGSVAGTIRPVLEMENTGMIRVRSLRPFPAGEIRKACSGLRSVGVLEKNISIGANGALYEEVKAALYGAKNRPAVSGFVAGLGGRDITGKDIISVLRKIKEGREGTEWMI